MVELGDVSGAAAAQADVIDPAWLFPAEFNVALAHIGHAHLRQIPLVTVRIVTAQAGEGDVALALMDVDVRVRLLYTLAHQVDILDGKAEMVEARAKSRLAL